MEYGFLHDCKHHGDYCPSLLYDDGFSEPDHNFLCQKLHNQSKKRTEVYSFSVTKFSLNGRIKNDQMEHGHCRRIATVILGCEDEHNVALLLDNEKE